ncbi:hypothetical protein C2845_PM03G21920 [Panicum miliaceum]|uniref:Thioredoxin domain-containing protein n=1 Tax=Panicum miliaceum TaxID=4540 RepID=A0A3L6TC32_PANMI|nr:hypothetical protein C2845_PM03G21920 [Panicum miliaceum]
MAAEEGVVIACHTKEEFDTQMSKAKDAGKLKYPGAVFLKVDVDELKEVAAEYKIEAMPTFLFIKNGEKIHTVIGARKEELQDAIDKRVAATAASASA